ncbi:thioredoxin domain-containing protein, partial [Thermodesulfobacteriota bacterium]
IHKNFSPHTVTLVKSPGSYSERLAVLAPFTANYTAINGKSTAYVCHGTICESPITDANQLVLLLNNLSSGQKG